MHVAAYARYSSDAQREASLEDQLRNCRQYAARMGWPEPVVYTDAAVSGARNDRPGYLRLLADAPRFDVILVDDLTRLSRDSVEATKATRRLTFAGVRVIGVSDGLDTGRKGHKAEVGLRGLMGELYLDDLREKTHRGLMGRALDGASAGGLPYGYRVSATGQREIREDQAEIVRRIYAEYLAGRSPREIVAGLNRDRVPSPRGRTWAASAVAGDVRRGIGILANPIYAGRQVWNRSRWVKHPDTGRRVRQERPQSEWVVTEHPELAIVDAGTWAAVERRLRLQSRATGGSAGRPPQHVLSGILRCGLCNGPMVVVDRYNYGCANAKQRGTCAGLRVARAAAEDRLLAAVRARLSAPEAFAEYQRAVQAHLRQSGGEATRRLAEARKWHGNVMAAIRAGIITPSTKADLEAAEAAVREAEAAVKASPARMVPRLRERWERVLADLAGHVRRSPQARAALVDVVGERVTVRYENGDLVAEAAASQLALVAGAGFGRWLREPLRVVLSRASRES